LPRPKNGSIRCRMETAAEFDDAVGVVQMGAPVIGK